MTISKQRAVRLALWTAIGAAAGILMASAAVSASPLETVNDAAGRALQKTIIWTSDNALPGQDAYFVAFRKRFTLPHAPRQASLQLFADVRYILWINGRYVERGPARFNPKGPEYDTVPVTNYVKSGENVIAVLVMANASNGKMMRHAPGLTAHLIVKTAQQAVTVTTDATWKWSRDTRYRPPAVDWGNVHDRIDTRAEDGDWTQPAYDDSRWQDAAPIDGTQWGELTARRIPLLRETPLPVTLADGRTFPVTLTAGQELRFTLPRFSQAYTVLDIDAGDGAALSLPYAHISYTARAGHQNYLSSDTCGFQAGSVRITSGRVTINNITLVERLYPFDCVGSFHSSDPQLDRIWAMCARSVQLMSEDSYVDCADRERTEWMDDDPPAFDIVRTALAGPGVKGAKSYADPRLEEELLRRTALTQQPDGWVKAHTCSDRFDIHAYMEDRSCDWVQGARRYYDSTGNVAPIREIWPVIMTQMDWFLAHRTLRGLVKAREWVVWGNPMGYQVCEGAGLNAFVYKALTDAAYLGRAVGETRQATKYADAARSLSDAFNTQLWDEKEGTYYSAIYGPGEMPQSSPPGHKLTLAIDSGRVEPTLYPALFALDQGIVPAARQARVAAYLLAHRAQADQPFGSEPGIMTYYYLFQQLYALRDPALDKEVIDTIRTKWQAMADTGWQVSWEGFTGGSKAHIYGAYPGYFLSAYVLGVRPDGPVGKKRLLIEPRLGNLTEAGGTVVTEFGPVPVAWKRTGGRLDFQLTVPQGVAATVQLPITETKPRLTLDGKAVPGHADGQYYVFPWRGGPHTGTLTAQ